MSQSLFLQAASEYQLAELARQPDRLRATARGGQHQRPAYGATSGARTDVLGLRQSWQVLHGLLAGSPWEGPRPANTLMAGGREIGADLGGGQPRLASAAETVAFAQYVAPLCPYRLRDCVDRRRVARTRFYAAESGECPELEDLRDCVVRDLPKLKAYLGRAANGSHGLLMWMM